MWHSTHLKDCTRWENHYRVNNFSAFPMAGGPLSILLPSWNHGQSADGHGCKKQFPRSRHDLWRFNIDSGRSVSSLIRYSKQKLHTLVTQINRHSWFQMQPSCCCWMSTKKEFVLASYSSWVIQSLFFSPKPCRSALRFTEPLTQRASASFPGNRTTGFETDKSTARIAEVQDDFRSNSNPPVGLQNVERDKFTFIIASENNLSS